MPFENPRIVADTDRVNRYQQQGLLVNGEPLTLNYVTPNAIPRPPTWSSSVPSFINSMTYCPWLKVNLATIRWLFLPSTVSPAKSVGKRLWWRAHCVCVAQQMDAMKNEPHEKMGKMVANWFIAIMDNWSLARWQLIVLNARVATSRCPL